MKPFWKKAFALMLAAVFIFGITPASNWLTVLVAAAPVSGTCGAEGGNLTWSLDPETGALTVSGTGDMADYDDEDNLPPWAQYTDSIRTVTIGEGVTGIGECAFNGCMGLEQVAIGTGVTRIGGDAFALTALRTVFVPASVEEIGPTAFVGLTVSGDEGDEEINPTLEKIDVDPANAFFSSVDGVLYDKTQTTLIQYPCGKPVNSFAIPDSVTEIADMAFPYCIFLEELTMPDGLTTIGSMAFLYCYMLGSVTIPGTVTTFGEEPFLGCLSLQSVTIENGVTEIPESLFTEFDALKSVTIPDSVTTIGAYAFAGCKTLADLTLGSGVEVIETRAFYGCESLTDLVIPDSVSVIADGAFAGCEGLASLTIGAGVETAAAYAFSNCPSLTSLTFNAVRCSALGDGLAFAGSVNIQTLSIGSGVTMIPAGAFLGMENVTAVVIPNSVTAIGAQAFQNCQVLADVTFGSGLETIGDYAFRNCAALTSLHIPSGVTSIGAGVLDNCESLSYICSDAEDGAAKSYAEANGIAFRLCDGHSGSAEPNTVSGVCGDEGDNVAWTIDLDTYEMTVSGTGAMADYAYEWFYDGPDDSDFAADTPWRIYRSSVSALTIGNGVTHIGANAFRAFTGLTSITFAGSVTDIGDWAFGECASLTDVSLPDSLTTIGQNAFAYCAGITSVTIPGSVVRIGEYAFMGTSVSSVYVPAGVQEIGASAFSCFTVSEDDDITPRLETIDVDPANAFFASEDGVLYNKAKTTLIQYPCAKANETFEIPDSVTALGDNAFAVCAALADIRIPDSVTAIGEWCFNYCPALTSVTIPDSVTELGGFAFAECLNLERVTIGSGVSAIGESAFSFCEKLTDVTIGSGAQVIGDGAFSYCESLAQIVIPANVTTIGEWAFAYSGLTTVTLPDGLAEIAESAFANCANLVSAHIPAGVTTIGEDAFADCPSLAYICSDTAYCLPRTYAEANGVEFRLCAGHESGAGTVCGVCGAEGGNVLWALNLGNGKMNLSGTGAMADYADASDAPWADYRASVQNVTVQSGVTNIGDFAFCGCTPLSDVTIGEDVTRIGVSAFDSAALTGVAIPAGVTEIGQNAFACGMRTEDGFTPTLRSIEVDPENAFFSAADGILYDKAQTVLIQYPAASPISLVEIPGTVTCIAAGAFRGGVNLMNVHIPYSVTEIGADAFDECGVLGYVCCDIAGSYAETYAAQNDIPFRFCDNHNGLNLAAGDANADGVVDLKDAVLIRRYLAGGWGDIRIYGWCADTDADGVITLQDVARIVRYLAGGWGVVLL